MSEPHLTYFNEHKVCGEERGGRQGVMLSAYILDHSDRTFLNLFFFCLLFGCKIIVIPIVLIHIIDCSKPRAFFYLLTTRTSLT